MPGKKKATGMSKRQSFLDRNVIEENKAILRFNESLVDAARGVERSRRSSDSGGPSPAGRTGRPRGARPSSRSANRPRTADRAVLPAGEEEALRSVVAAATDDPDLNRAGAALVDSLARGARFPPAAEAGWRALAEPAGGDRSAEEWDRLRAGWTMIRRAALAEWVRNHPEAAELQERELKAHAARDRSQSRPAARRRARRTPSSGRRTGGDGAGGGSAPAAEASAEALSPAEPASPADASGSTEAGTWADASSSTEVGTSADASSSTEARPEISAAVEGGESDRRAGGRPRPRRPRRRRPGRRGTPPHAAPTEPAGADPTSHLAVDGPTVSSNEDEPMASLATVAPITEPVATGEPGPSAAETRPPSVPPPAPPAAESQPPPPAPAAAESQPSPPAASQPPLPPLPPSAPEATPSP